MGELIARNRLTVVFELGTYCGYSPVRFASKIIRHNFEAKYYSFEVSLHSVKIAQAVVKIVLLLVSRTKKLLTFFNYISNKYLFAIYINDM
jgi:predicted O-methyltransferase YrrM